MSELLYSTQSPMNFQSNSIVSQLSNKCKDLQFQLSQRDQQIIQLKLEIDAKNYIIQQLENKVQRQEQIQLEEQCKTLNRKKTEFDAFEKYFENKSPNNLQNKQDLSVGFDEKFLSPMNYRGINPNDQSMSPFTQDLNDEHSIPESQLKHVEGCPPKIKGKLQGEAYQYQSQSYRDQCLSYSKKSNNTNTNTNSDSSHSNHNLLSMGSGIKRSHHQLTHQPPPKMVLENTDNIQEDQSVVKMVNGVKTREPQNNKLYEEFFYLGATQTDIAKCVTSFIQHHGEHQTNLPTLKTKATILYRQGYCQSHFIIIFSKKDFPQARAYLKEIFITIYEFKGSVTRVQELK